MLHKTVDPLVERLLRILRDRVTTTQPDTQTVLKIVVDHVVQSISLSKKHRPCL